MAFRQFVDPDGVDWTVYDVVPRDEERRTTDRRDPTHLTDDSQLERRSDDRRATIGSPRPVRLTRGWLCFESHGERRRLQPIPENWLSLPDSDLVSMMQQARVAPRRNSVTP